MIQLLHGDALTVLATLPAGSVQTIVTSPPYFGLRAYSTDPREIGREAAPDCLAWARREQPCGACYVCALRAVFAQLWRVLRDDGTAWVNLGDSMAANWASQRDSGGGGFKDNERERITHTPGFAPKNLLMIPARVALALQADGWILRSDCIWSKPNPMPESVTDRPTRAHEYVFLLSKKPRYYYDQEAIAEACSDGTHGGKEPNQHKRWSIGMASQKTTLGATQSTTRNKRSVWTISTQPVKMAHFATMPEALIEPCILAGSSAQACEHCGAAWRRVVEKGESSWERRKADGDPMRYGLNGNAAALQRSLSDPEDRAAGGFGKPAERRDLGFSPGCACADNTGSARSVVLDPFAGSGTVLRVAERFQRDAIGIDLNADYIDLQEKRTDGVQVELFV